MSKAFWAFSLRFYQLPGVAESCIELQDRHGADVNLVLFALWAAASGHRLDAEALAAADHAAVQWRETVTQPLRAARRALKATPDRFDESEVTALRGQVMVAELESERLQQGAMARDLTLDAHGASVEAAQQNLSLYEALLGKQFESGPIERLLQAFVVQSSRPACDSDSASTNASVTGSAGVCGRYVFAI
jgi:uncharacterized protein (TIGR02444 family)